MQTTTATPATPSTAAEILNGAQALQTAPPVTSEPPKADEGKRISGQIAAMLQREKRNLEIESRNKAKEQDLADKLKRIEEFEAAKADPMKALALLGLDYETLTKAQLSDGQVPPEVEIKKIDQKLDSFLQAQKLEQQQRLDLEKKREEQESQRILSEFQTEISDYVKAHSERYEFITFENAQDLVYSVIDEHYKRTEDPTTGKGEVLTISQASDKVEEYLEKKYVKAKELKKLQALLQPVALSKQPIKTNPVNSQKAKTLTNQASATPSQSENRILNDDERIRRAIAYAKGLRT